jgi:4-hydroxy-tetrahydrodipicolinate synthase
MALLTSRADGVFAIAPTAFQDDGSIDYPSMERLADFYAQVGCDGITVLGIMGEAPKLEMSEATLLAKRVIERFSGQVIVGVSAPGFASMRQLAREAMGAGAAAVMIAPPSTLRTDDQIVSYYEQAAEAIGPDVPFVIQDYPLTIGVVMTPSVIRRVVQGNSSCVMVKHEDWPGLEKISALRAFERDGSMRRISILCGNGGLFLDFELERGADGAMTGYAFPDMLVDVVRLSKSARRETAHDLFDAHLPLLRYEQQPVIGLAVRKYVLHRRGLLASPAQRRPNVALSADAKREVDYLLARLGRSDTRAAQFIA